MTNLVTFQDDVILKDKHLFFVFLVGDSKNILRLRLVSYILRCFSKVPVQAFITQVKPLLEILNTMRP